MQLHQSLQRLSRLGVLLLLAAVVLMTLPHVFAQTSRGTITGLVTDPKGAVIAGADIEIESIKTGVKRTTKSNEAGLYRFDAVDLGEYNLKVNPAGFQTLVNRGLIIEAGATISKDVRLEVGTTQSVVEVAADAVTLSYEAAGRGGSITSVAISEMPQAFSRDVAQFALTLPGVSTNRFNAGNATFAVNGGGGRSNNIR